MRRGKPSEDGLTLVEIAVAGLVSAIIFAGLAAILVSVQGLVNDEEDRTVNNDQARLAIQALDRDIRSANFIWRDQSDPGWDHRLLVDTQSNAPSFGKRCVEYRISDRELQRRTWPPNSPGSASAWQTIATDIVNDDRGVPAFTLRNLVTTGGRSVEVTILANSDYDDDPDATASIKQSLTGRNVGAGSGTPPANPPPPCDTIPPQ